MVFNTVNMVCVEWAVVAVVVVQLTQNQTIRPYLVTAQYQGNQVLLWFDPAKTLWTKKQHKHRAFYLANLKKFQLAIIFFKVRGKNSKVWYEMSQNTQERN